MDKIIELDNSFIDEHTRKELAEKLFNNNLNNVFFYPTFGLSNDVPIFRYLNHMYAKILFKLLDNMKLDYYLFAGSSVGYARNKKTVPWVDDYDILIFTNQTINFIKNVVPVIKQYGFILDNEKFGWKIMSKFGSHIFLCDVFLTQTKNKILQNISNLGRYSDAKIPVNCVLPKQTLTIDDDLTVPFFNNIDMELSLTYGDVIENCTFNINHNPKCILYKNFNYVYHSFLDIKNQVIKNTLEPYQDHEYINDIILNIESFNKNNIQEYQEYEIKNLNIHSKNMHIYKIKNVIDFIYNRKAKEVFIDGQNYLFFCPDIKYFFPKIKIKYLFDYNFYAYNAIMLNFVDVVCYKDVLNYSLLDVSFALKKVSFENIFTHKICFDQIIFQPAIELSHLE